MIGKFLQYSRPQLYAAANQRPVARQIQTPQQAMQPVLAAQDKRMPFMSQPMQNQVTASRAMWNRQQQQPGFGAMYQLGGRR